jgi:hypothetical protein
VDYAKLLEMDSFFTWYIFLQVGKTQNLPSKIWETLGVALISLRRESCNDIYIINPTIIYT